MAVAVYAATLCFLAYNFFFIEPRFTFYIDAGEGVATVALFLVVALICGRLANRLRTQVLLLRTTHAQTEALQGLGQRLAAAADEGEVVRAATQALRAALEVDVVVLAADETGRRLVDAGTDRDGVPLDLPLACGRRLVPRAPAARRTLAPTRCRARRGGACRWSPANARSVSPACALPTACTTCRPTRPTWRRRWRRTSRRRWRARAW